MENESNKYLSYGSVVKLKDDSRYYMIIGLQVQLYNKSTKKEEYIDYSSISLPKGYTGEDNIILFNSESIEKVIFNGYTDKNVASYLEDIKWEVDRRKKDE